MGVGLLAALLEPATNHGIVHTMRVATVATTAVSIADFWHQLTTTDRIKKPRLHPKIVSPQATTEALAGSKAGGSEAEEGEPLVWDPYQSIIRGYGYGALLTPLLFPLIPTLFPIPAKQPLVPSLYCLGWTYLVMLPIGGAVHFFFHDDRESFAPNSLRIFVGAGISTAVLVLGSAVATGSLYPLAPFSVFGHREHTKVCFNACGMLLGSLWMVYSSSFYVKWLEVGATRHQNSNMEVGNIACYTIGLATTFGLCTILTFPTSSKIIHWFGAGFFFAGMGAHCCAATAMEHIYGDDHRFGLVHISCAFMLVTFLCALFMLKGSGGPVLMAELAILTPLNVWFLSLIDCLDDSALKSPIRIEELKED